MSARIDARRAGSRIGRSLSPAFMFSLSISTFGVDMPVLDFCWKASRLTRIGTTMPRERRTAHGSEAALAMPNPPGRASTMMEPKDAFSDSAAISLPSGANDGQSITAGKCGSGRAQCRRGRHDASVNRPVQVPVSARGWASARNCDFASTVRMPLRPVERSCARAVHLLAGKHEADCARSC